MSASLPQAVSMDQIKASLRFPKLITITREKLVEVLAEWRREWDTTPHQFLLNEAFRQSDAATYSEEMADYLLAKLITDEKGGAA